MKGFGETLARTIEQRIHDPVASVTALAAVGASDRYDGQSIIDMASGTHWVYSATSTAADATSTLVVTPADSPSAGRWTRADRTFDIKVAIAFGTADAAVLFTVPTGFRIRVLRAFWDVTVAFSGGSSSAIGISSSNATFNTKGDILGGASGDVAAALGTGALGGTVGAKLASSGFVGLVAADTLRFDRITSVFTAGSGFAHISCQRIA